MNGLGRDPNIPFALLGDRLSGIEIPGEAGKVAAGDPDSNSVSLLEQIAGPPEPDGHRIGLIRDQQSWACR